MCSTNRRDCLFSSLDTSQRRQGCTQKRSRNYSYQDSRTVSASNLVVSNPKLQNFEFTCSNLCSSRNYILVYEDVDSHTCSNDFQKDSFGVNLRMCRMFDHLMVCFKVGLWQTYWDDVFFEPLRGCRCHGYGDLREPVPDQEVVVLEPSTPTARSSDVVTGHRRISK